jgi:hypothetical protein
MSRRVRDAEPPGRRGQLRRVEPIEIRRQPGDVEDERDDENYESWRRYSSSFWVNRPEPPCTPSLVPMQLRWNVE